MCGTWCLTACRSAVLERQARSTQPPARAAEARQWPTRVIQGNGTVALASAPALRAAGAGLAALLQALRSPRRPAWRMLQGFARPVVHFSVSPPVPLEGGFAGATAWRWYAPRLALQPRCGFRKLRPAPFDDTPIRPLQGALGATSLPSGWLLAAAKSLRGAVGRLRPWRPPRRPWGTPLVWLAAG
jgi:hypothetical protein